jgi:hypothetical protein
MGPITARHFWASVRPGADNKRQCLPEPYADRQDTVQNPRLFLATEIDVGRGVHKKSQAAVFTAKIIFRSHFQDFLPV